jgi:hypothetical protein
MDDRLMIGKIFLFIIKKIFFLLNEYKWVFEMRKIKKQNCNQKDLLYWRQCMISYGT